MPASPPSSDDNDRLLAVEKLRLIGTPAEERFDKITRLARQMFDVPMAIIDILGEKLAWLKSVQGFDQIEGLRKDSYCHYTIMHDEINLIHDARNDPRVCNSVYADTWVFYAGVPLHFEGVRVGVLCIGDTKPRNFTVEELKPLCDLAALAERELEFSALSESQYVLAMSNEELKKKANIDILTRMWNRGAILEIASKELALATSDTTMGLLIIDIDNYKTINDSYGHVAGDLVLRDLANHLRQIISPKNAIGRYGGDEFLVVVKNTNTNEIREIASRICEDIAKIEIYFEKHTIKVTCSVGCTISYGLDELVTLFRRADQALYSAKNAGRNSMDFK